VSKQPANVHDAFFKQVLSDPMLAGTFLREHLPPDIASLLSPELPEPVPGSFLDEDLRQHHSDLLFRVHLKRGPEAYAYVLMEHKSSRDPAARLQLLRYVVRVLVDWYEQNKQQLPLPPVLPLLAHQGPGSWEISCEFADLFGKVPEPLRPYLPSFRHALVDLDPMDDRTLSAEVRLRAFLKALKYSRRSDLLDCIGIVFEEAPKLDDKDLFVVLTYLDKGSKGLNSKVLYEALERLVPERKERIMGCLTQPYFDTGKAEGHAEGLAEGVAKGGANLLTRLLEKRFGALPTATRQRIFSADLSCIDAWVERAVNAPDLRSVFGSN
jgi:predicted transposase YdaD